ncbi:glycoside hydrolase family 88/105 protein [Hufsiella ginkgonis]|uniref:Glycoside hydrolase family 88 protein n=1 Tax=Hufsiella ginkgonis TaxID=2695274 RepID=A0A7K1XZ22_9SPHI|nr:glycoside hydrolase family 88 protein [Hufsiella ginkgonis]MXV16254.1 glycoside hydrolase family 88 protein [Hufsiella ginkgonis]
MKHHYLICLLASGLLACAPSLRKPDKQPAYSQKMVENRAMKRFFSNRGEQELATAHWDYVPGLVAYSVLKAWEQYPEKTEYYRVVKAYADHCLQGKDTVGVGVSNIDDLAAGRIFFTLYQTELKKGNKADAVRYKTCVTVLRNKLKYDHRRISAGKPGTGGFFHKAQYPNQMWLDGLYMGPAMYAGWQTVFGKETGDEDNRQSWDDITLQFKTIHRYTYDTEKQLNYHAWSADPDDENSFWARKSGPFKGCSREFWGRGMGWYFAALVDVLELMPKERPGYDTLKSIVNQVAAGLARYQDKTSGCWYQLLQYDGRMIADNKGDLVAGQTFNGGNKSNYLESSASSMFTYAYLKGIRLKVLDRGTYLPVAEKAYLGLLTNFIREESNGELSITQSCASAGLGPAKDRSRTGTINYYLCGKDVTVTQNEGKAIGPFILASLEFERRK